MNHRSLTAIAMTAFIAGSTALLGTLPAYAVPPTAAQLPRGTAVYSADGKPVATVVDVLQNGNTGINLAVLDVTTELGEHRMVLVPAVRLNAEGGKVYSIFSYETIEHMPIFDYSAMGPGH